GASGYEEDGKPRLVKTPWTDAPVPFEEAAETGTRKVIEDHSTIGVLVTTDGSVTEIPRADYAPVEERVVTELKALQKPFVIVLNCKTPSSVKSLKKEMEDKYGAPVVAINVEKAGEEEFAQVLQTALFEFPVSRIDIQIPKWLQSFPESNATVGALTSALKKVAPSIEKMRDCTALETLFDESSDYENPTEIRMDLGTGKVEAFFGVKEGLFYRELSKACGAEITDELQLMTLMRSLSSMQGAYEKVKTALADAEQYGYGVVSPTPDEYALAKPVMVKRGAGYGVQFKATATSYHIVKVDVVGRVQSIVGTKAQSETFVGDTVEAFEKGDNSVWETNIFGRTLKSLVSDELSGKTQAVSPELRSKIRRVASKAVNEGKNNLFYFLF
ncbi:MAG: stage IV sporulation protein A, partial [Clostridia bacterium]|nr:stage IV sporulation protein A [Clostridia bacterium]